MPDGEELSGVGRTSGARNDETRILMEEAVKAKKCPFCSPYFEEKNAERIIALGITPDHWHVFHTSGPFPGTELHVVIAPKRHVKLMRELTDQELSEWQEIIEDLQDMFGFESFARIVREGLMDFNSATVEHLHSQIIISSGDPATDLEIPEPYRSIVRQLYHNEVGKLGEEDALESLDTLRWYIDVYRHQLMGKAIPIRAKLSNKVGVNTPL